MTARWDDVRWTTFAVLLFIAPALFWLNEPPARRFHHPDSPLDLTLEPAAHRWIFLASARPLLPRDVAVTVRAASADEEMSLYMFAVGLFPKNRVVPRSYWGATVEPKLHADYELAYGCVGRGLAGEVIADVPYGCLRKAAR